MDLEEETFPSHLYLNSPTPRKLTKNPPLREIPRPQFTKLHIPRQSNDSKIKRKAKSCQDMNEEVTSGKKYQHVESRVKSYISKHAGGPKTLRRYQSMPETNQNMEFDPVLNNAAVIEHPDDTNNLSCEIEMLKVKLNTCEQYFQEELAKNFILQKKLEDMRCDPPLYKSDLNLNIIKEFESEFLNSTPQRPQPLTVAVVAPKLMDVCTPPPKSASTAYPVSSSGMQSRNIRRRIVRNLNYERLENNCSLDDTTLFDSSSSQRGRKRREKLRLKRNKKRSVLHFLLKCCGKSSLKSSADCLTYSNRHTNDILLSDSAYNTRD